TYQPLFSTSPPPPITPLFPYTTLFRSCLGMEPVGIPFLQEGEDVKVLEVWPPAPSSMTRAPASAFRSAGDCLVERICLPSLQAGDRKSTRLNSSHSQISYAVFCLKKKK